MLQKERRKLIIPFLAPAVLLYLVFFVYPTISGLFTALYDWPGFKLPSKFVGLANFTELFGDDNFRIAMQNSMFLLFVGGIITFGLAFLLTALLTSGVRFKRFFRAVIFFPNIVAPIALVALWQFIYNPQFGLLNGVLTAIGLGQFTQTWAGPGRLFPAITVIIVWVATGYYLVLLLAAADKIPQEIYDAGRVDGASAAQMFIQVTLPMIWNVIAVSLVLWMIAALKQFEFAYAFSSTGLIPPEAYTLPIYVVVMGFGYRYPIYRLGYASAIGCVLLALVVVFTFLILRFTRRESVEY